MRNQRDLGSPHLAPRTRIAIPKLQEVDWTVELGAPVGGGAPGGAIVDLDERSGTQEWVHRVVFQPDVAILTVAYVELLNQGNGHFAPDLDHPRDEAGLVETEALIEAYWETDRLFRVEGLKGCKVRML